MRPSGGRFFRVTAVIAKKRSWDESYCSDDTVPDEPRPRRPGSTPEISSETATNDALETAVDTATNVCAKEIEASNEGLALSDVVVDASDDANLALSTSKSTPSSPENPSDTRLETAPDSKINNRTETSEALSGGKAVSDVVIDRDSESLHATVEVGQAPSTSKVTPISSEELAKDMPDTTSNEDKALSDQAPSRRWRIYRRLPKSGRKILGNMQAIIMNDPGPVDACKIAQEASEEPALLDGLPNLVFYTDGSDSLKKNMPYFAVRGGSYGVARKNFKGSDAADGNGQAILMGIVEALARAVRIVVEKNLRKQRVRIFTDSDTLVKVIKKLVGKRDSYDKSGSFLMSYLSPMLDKIIELAEVLDKRECWIMLRWVKRNTIDLQKMADEVCTMARKDDSWVNPPRNIGYLDDMVLALAAFFEEKWREFLLKNSNITKA
ncbi:hypothetical protein QBC34DRAFT_424123 [Podospora aff. communis PSN243]|uniref:RNase H type-1 domain-containing protein n=1 Tax=Podospora aff. communis PSN243 TaxID=3040156 RepID=A0AAV9GU36_9PEZI|nr:hypothetical protein QBC34DRAFT_424123 [Podospora aff. communis PSN243]